MRFLLVLAVAAMAGCASHASQRPMPWNLVPARLGGSQAPSVQGDQLVLAGQAVRSQDIYRAPFTIECELQAARASTNNSFLIDLVSDDVATTEPPKDYIAIELVDGQSVLRAWLFHDNQPAHLLKSTMIPVESGRRYKVVVEVERGDLVVYVNGRILTAPYNVASAEFHVELDTSLPSSSWHVHNFSIR